MSSTRWWSGGVPLPRCVLPSSHMARTALRSAVAHVPTRRSPLAQKPTTVRPTKASQKLGTRAAGSAEAAAKEPFKLSKFKKVAPRVYASSPQRAEAGARRSTTLSAAGSAAAGHRRSPKSLSPRSVGSLDSPPHAGSEVY